MSETDLLLELNPTPGTVVKLVKKLVDEPWPRSDQERENLFARLGFISGGPVRARERRITPPDE